MGRKKRCPPILCLSANDGGKWWRRHTGWQPRVAPSLGRRIRICCLFTACKPGLADNQMPVAGIPGRVPVQRRAPLSVVAGSTNKRAIFIRLCRNAKCLVRVHVSCALGPSPRCFFFFFSFAYLLVLPTSGTRVTRMRSANGTGAVAPARGPDARIRPFCFPQHTRSHRGVSKWPAHPATITAPGAKPAPSARG